MSYFGIISENKITQDQVSYITSIITKKIINNVCFVTKDKFFLAYDSSQPHTNNYSNETGDTLVCLGNIYSNFNTIIDKKALCHENVINLGSHFVEHVYGDYILIGYNEISNSLSLFRDPSGQSYLFYIRKNNQIIFSSNINLITEFLQDKPPYNMAYFISYINNSFINSNETPFLNIYELPQGYRLKYAHKTLTPVTPVWDPLKYCKQTLTMEDFTEKFIQSTIAIVRSNLRLSDKIVLEYSGGLDSTALLYFIHSYVKDKKIITINFYDEQVNSSNETHYAKKVTENLGIVLETIELSSLLPFSPINYKNSILPNWPTASMIYNKQMDYVTDQYLIPNKQSSIVYASGHGGDNLFMCPPFKEAIADYFIECGFKGLSNKIQDFCILERESFIRLIGPLIQCYKNYLFAKIVGGAILFTPNDPAPWFTQKAHDINNIAMLHPLGHGNIKNITPGKIELLKSIIFGLSTIKCNLRPNNFKTFYPFFSQPLIELCLMLPIYNTFSKEYNRHHIRSIISHHFKTNNVWRRDKGETSGILQRGLIENQTRVFERCMEGVMARNGFINKDIIYHNLKNLKNGQNNYQWQISSLVCAEIFFELWQ